jgi:hypothetical protein
MGWNNRVVKRLHTWVDAKGQQRSDYTYGIHEAYYDKNDKVVEITEDAIECHGETIEELRRHWCMMAEAFGQPILDFDKIPEEGHDTENPLVKIDDLRKELEIEAAKSEESESDEPEENTTLFPDFDHAAYEKEQLEELQAAEKNHRENFEGTHPLEALVHKIFSDYQESRKRD